ncbi:MAG: thiol:disulfide interchange protein DsbG [Gammaproteobacteria bacterium]|nr:thiol:disulfide interchange protein DsbG [Gammaproteobacteria bacterium]
MSLCARCLFFSRLTVFVWMLSISSLWASDYPRVIQSLEGRGMKVEKSFPAVSGMTGWLISINGRYTIVYTSKDNKTLIAGSLYDETGNDISSTYKDKYIPKPDYRAAYDALTNASYIVEGKKASPKSVIHVFFDPNCFYCHKAWVALQPYEDAGLQVRWIPVAYLSPSSFSKAIKMLDANDKTAVFRKGMQNFAKERSAPADIKPEDKPEIADLLQKNDRLWKAFGMTGTPAIVWKLENGEIGISPGLPRPEDLPKITGITLAK